MKEKKVRKTLAVKVSEDFYDEVVKFAHENYMNVSTLLRKALFEAYGLAESTTAASHRSNE